MSFDTQAVESDRAEVELFERKMFHETRCREDRCLCRPAFPTADEQKLMNRLGVTIYRKPAALSAASLPPPTPEQELQSRVAELEERVARLEERL